MRQLAVVMFNDVVGYTALVQHSEPQARIIYNLHLEGVDKYVNLHQGRVIQYFGDGALCTFSSTLHAVECAINLQVYFHHSHKVKVRIGMHLGEVIFTKENLFGDAVNIASRIESLAMAGSVLISERIYLEIANQPEIKTLYFGLYHFKNVRQPMKIYALEHPQLVLPSQVHEQAKLENISPSYSIPSSPDEFIGREKVLDQLATLVLESQNKAVTILGMGGMGKTRLCMEVVGKLKSKFTEGAVFVSLDTIESANQIADTLGSALGLRENAEATWLDTIKHFLQNKHILVALDNFEHLLSGAPQIEEILQVCPLVTVISTSRKNLDIKSEIEFPVLSMQLPDLHTDPPDMANECIRLFQEKARKVNPNFTIDQSNFRFAAQICGQLEGMPLAIELAAARIKMFSVQAILNHLSDLFKVLKSSKKTSKRHQAIFETIQWSYQLLSENEQKALQAYAVIPGLISISIAEAMTPNLDAFEMIEALVNQSLLNRSTDENQSRFKMLRVIRTFGLKMLDLNGLVAEKQLLLANHTLQFLKKLQSNKSISKDVRYRHLDDEIERIKFAQRYWEEHDLEKCAFIFLLIWPYFLERGEIREAFEKASFLGGQVKREGIKVSLWTAQGTLAHNLGQFLLSRDSFHKALTFYKKTRSRVDIYNTLNHLSWAEFRLGNYDKSLSYAESAYREALSEKDIGAQAKSLNNQSWVLHSRGKLREGKQLQSQALDLYEQLQYDSGIAFCKANLGWIEIDMGNNVLGKSLISEAINYFQGNKNQQLFAYSNFLLGTALIETRDFELAMEKLNAIALPIFSKIGDTWGLAQALDKMSEISLATGHASIGQDFLAKSLEIRTRNEDKWGIAKCHLIQAKYHVDQDDQFEAKRQIEIAQTKSTDAGYDQILAELAGISMKLMLEDKKFILASKQYHRALNYLYHPYQIEKFERQYQSDIDFLKEYQTV